MDKIAYKRIKFEHEGRTIYEWEQSLEEVHCYIRPPDGVTARQLDIAITPRHLRVGIKGNPPFLDADFCEGVNAEESVWTLEDGEIHLAITKGSKAVTWSSFLKGHGAIDPAVQQEVQKSLMLERWQDEHPGFDFSGATFNGAVPDPKQFMGGAGYK